METYGDPPAGDDLTVASLIMDNSVALIKDHTYLVSAAVRRNQSQWCRMTLFSAGYGLVHTESFDALDDGTEDSGWQRLYLHFRAPINLQDAYLQFDNIVLDFRTADDQTCKMWVDDVQVIDLGIQSYYDTYSMNYDPSMPQFGIRNRYFGASPIQETVTITIGNYTYTCEDMPTRWNMAMAIDDPVNHAAGYPQWGQEIPDGLNNTSDEAGFIKVKAADTSMPSWPAMAPDGVLINTFSNLGQRHILSFDYGAKGETYPLLRVFMIKSDFSHYSSLFVSPLITIPGSRMWPLTLQYTPDFSDEFILVRFDNVTIGPPGTGSHTDETTAYIDNVKMNVVTE